MATVRSLTAERMLEIEGASVVDGDIVGGNLILRTFSGAEIDAGAIPPGPTGPVGPSGGQIPGEVKLWPGDVLPLLANFGLWVWADGAVYDTPLYPVAADHIADVWRTFGGASDPGVNKFRAPDLRGLTPVGLDKMPGGTRANRLTRSVSIVLAGITGEETHVITLPESPNHNHPITMTTDYGGTLVLGSPWDGAAHETGDPSGYRRGAAQNIYATAGYVGGGGAHETMQKSVFVPWIVKLDD